MPVDVDGNRADIITSPDSIPGRMNLGRVYAPYFSGASRDITRQMLEEFGLNRHLKRLTDELIDGIPIDRLEQGLNTLLRFYSIVSPEMEHKFRHLLSDEERRDWLKMLVNEKPWLMIPIDTKEQFDSMVLKIESEFKLVYGPVEYIGESGEKVRTASNVRVAPLYIMLLDKIADTWLSVDIGSMSHFGILSGHNRTTKYGKPWKKSSPKNIGETEGHIDVSYGGRHMLAELRDRNASIVSQRLSAQHILRAKFPTNIDNLIDRKIHPYQKDRPLQFVQHYLRPAGAELVYVEEEKSKE